jgi:hypothetical protein
MSKLTKEEIKELIHLRILKSFNNRWLSQEEYDRLKSLEEKKFKS